MAKLEIELIYNIIKMEENKMKNNMTKEQVDTIVNEVSCRVNDNIAQLFAEKLESFTNISKDNPKIKGAEGYFAAMSASMEFCVETLKETLKELLFD